MSLIPWKHKESESTLPTTGLRTEMDRLFNSFFGETFGSLPAPWAAWRHGDWGPPIDVEETDKQIVVRAEIPGVKPEELELSIHGNTLVISGEKKESVEHKDRGYLYQERRFGSFHREVPLPATVDSQQVAAEYHDGVLHVTLDKGPETQAHRIEIKAK